MHLERLERLVLPTDGRHAKVEQLDPRRVAHQARVHRRDARLAAVAAAALATAEQRPTPSSGGRRGGRRASTLG